MDISFTAKGSFDNTEKFLRSLKEADFYRRLESAGAAGVAALAASTPADTGLAGNSWYYEIEKTRSSARIVWKNSDIENGFPVAIMIQYGHGTGTGGYVQGRDYINPAMQPVFDRIADDVWKAVTG